ncbi:MAG TPA: hypothetical protein VEK84_18155, partial [Terriglobales bacterium]|nr:hypothetical protein [Terriglobales bacterium]
MPSPRFRKVLTRSRDALLVFFVAQLFAPPGRTQEGHNAPAPAPAAAYTRTCKDRAVPQLEDITAKAGIKFRHLSSPDKKYILE